MLLSSLFPSTLNQNILLSQNIMEPAAECISEEWSCLSGLYTAGEADFLTQLLGSSSVSVLNNGNSDLGIPSAIWPATESTIVSITGISNTCLSASNADDTNLFCLPQGNSCNSYVGTTTTASGEHYSSSEICIGSLSMSMGFCLDDAKISPYSVQGIDLLSQVMNENIDQESGQERAEKGFLADNNLQQTNRECEMLVSHTAEEDGGKIMQNSSKRSTSSTQVPKNKRNLRSKKSRSASIGKNVNADDGCLDLQGQRSSSCCSEDESNASQELNGGASSSLSPKDPAALKLNGKARATKGSATDPQSLYARRRRERINERLRILQKLVPNGTKVDISTMLEEAVQYVKFLQLQIKLLSSDDLWMYAPIAYNGMNIGLDLNITPTKQP